MTSQENGDSGTQKENTLLTRLADIRQLHQDIANEHLRVEGVTLKSPTSPSRHSPIPGQQRDLSAEFARRKQSTDIIMAKLGELSNQVKTFHQASAEDAAPIKSTSPA